MAAYQAPLQDLRFNLKEICELESALLSLPPYGDFSIDLIDSVLDEAARFGTEVIAPLNRSGDLEGCELKADGTVVLPKGFAAAYQSFVAQGWNAAPFPAEATGQGLPFAVATGIQEIWHGANLSFALMPLLTHSAVHLLLHYGTEFERTYILPKLVSGEWTGTMCMTEPQAGSDVGAVRAMATPQADGSYRLKGSKIFISCGDHDASANIIHMVLARVPDAPEGSAGLSLFMVPKILVNPDGSLGAKNDVKAVSLEHKLGMHATPTAVMAYGDAGGAYASIVGKPGEGLKNMFLMMNAARLAVGLEGLGIAEAATQAAETYAAERVQGRVDRKPATIDKHPDVIRMLRFMRSHTAALRGLALYTGRLLDLSAYHTDEIKRREAKQRLDLLTPIVKAHTTSLAFTIASESIQVHGGLGYIEETGVAQFLRDVRVAMIYEGTNGIQALDLAHRKLPMEGGQVVQTMIEEMKTVATSLTASNDYTLMPLGKAFAVALDHLQEATRSILLQVQHTQHNTKGEAPSSASAVPYLTLLGLCVEGWLMGQAALKTKTASGYSAAFLEAKLLDARFMLLDTLLDCSSLKARVLLGDSNIRDSGPGST